MCSQTVLGVPWETSSKLMSILAEPARVGDVKGGQARAEGKDEGCSRGMENGNRDEDDEIDWGGEDGGRDDVGKVEKREWKIGQRSQNGLGIEEAMRHRE